MKTLITLICFLNAIALCMLAFYKRGILEAVGVYCISTLIAGICLACYHFYLTQTSRH